jgi:hypothetical protein
MDASESYIIARRTLACPTDRNHKSKQTIAGTPNQITPHTVVPLGVLNLEMNSSEWAGKWLGIMVYTMILTPCPSTFLRVLTKEKLTGKFGF